MAVGFRPMLYPTELRAHQRQCTNCWASPTRDPPQRRRAVGRITGSA